MSKKVTYRVRNWKSYNESLVKRGNLTIWVSEDSLKSWYSKRPKQKKRGRPQLYSDSCIELALTLRSLFKLPLRGTQGFLQGLMSMLGLLLQVPHYSRFSRRASELELKLKRFAINNEQPSDLVIDSTGLKIYGEGEWKMRIHGKQKRRTWRKLHIAADPNTYELTAIELTESNVHDCKVLKSLLLKEKKLGKVYADGAYTFKENFDAIAKLEGQPFIPIRNGTAFATHDYLSGGEILRNKLLRETLDAGGQELWKKSSGYHRRSLVETQMFRIKTILGNSLKSRTFNNQRTEVLIMANILNTMTSLGMPISEKVA